MNAAAPIKPVFEEAAQAQPAAAPEPPGHAIMRSQQEFSTRLLPFQPAHGRPIRTARPNTAEERRRMAKDVKKFRRQILRAAQSPARAAPVEPVFET